VAKISLSSFFIRSTSPTRAIPPDGTGYDLISYNSIQKVEEE